MSKELFSEFEDKTQREAMALKPMPFFHPLSDQRFQRRLAGFEIVSAAVMCAALGGGIALLASVAS